MGKTVRELHEKRMKMWDQSILNHKKYINPETGFFLDKYTGNRTCPVCGRSNELEIFFKEGGRYVKCKNCTLIYLNPVFQDFAIKDYHESNHSEQSMVLM